MLNVFKGNKTKLRISVEKGAKWEILELKNKIAGISNSVMSL